MVSMKDIAKELNLSRCTVSNILNNKLENHSYKAETISMVREKADEMGYVSNTIARSLKTGSTRTLAIVVPHLSNPFYINIIQRVEKLTNEKDYSLIICTTEEKVEKEEHVLDMLTSRMVDGVLISPVSYVRSLKKKYAYKIVCFDRTVEGNKYPSVLFDNESAAYSMMQKLLKRGKHMPVFLNTARSDYTIKCRMSGYARAIQEADREVQPSHVFYDIYDKKQSYEVVSRLLLEKELEFDSIVLGTNFCIYGVLKALRENDADIPIAGFEDFNGSDVIAGDILKSIQPEEKMGEDAFHMLLECLAGQEPDNIILKTEDISAQ